MLILLPIERLPPVYGLAASLFSVTFLAQSLSHIILPILFAAGVKIQDDVISFILNSGLSPIVVSLLGLTFLSVSILVFLLRTDFHGILKKLEPERKGGN